MHPGTDEAMVRNLAPQRAESTDLPPVASIVRAVDSAAVAWSDPAFAPRVRARDAAIVRTGYSLPVVEHALDALFSTLRAPAIERVIADELGSPDVLDSFSPRQGRPKARALPLGRICIVSSRTTLGVAVVPAVFALCAKCDVLVKDRNDGLVASFFATLGDTCAPLRERIVAKEWDGENGLRSEGSFDCVVAFGSDATLERIAAELPAKTRFIGYGTRASAGYVSRAALADESSAREIAAGAARDLLLYDGEGCLSLHALFVERDGAVAVARFAELLADAIARTAKAFPPGRCDAASAARVAAARDLAAFRGTTAYSDPQASYLLSCDPPVDEPPLFLPRALGMYGVDGPQDARAYLRRHGVRLEALAIAGPAPALLDAARAMGVARIARFGEMQRPALGGFHGGRPRIAEFVRWMSDES